MIYFVRHDGTQTNKANATRGGSPGQALSIAGFNGETFAAGDEIIFEQSGTYSGVIQVAGTGTAAAPIVVRGPGPLEHQMAVVSVTGQNGISITGDYLHVKNFKISATDNKCVFIGENSGVGGYTVKVFDCIAQANAGGDGFGTNSTVSDVSECEFIRCEARAITGLNNQGFTHHSDQKIILTDCRTTRACEYAMTMIGNECTVNGGEFYAIDTIFQFSQGCVGVVNDAIAVADVGANSRLVTVADDGSSATFNNCTLRHLSPSTRNNSLVNNTVSITINGGLFQYTGGATSGFEWSTAGAAGGVLTFRNVLMKLGAMGVRLARTLTTGGAIRLERVTLDVSEIANASAIVAFEIRNTSNGLKSWIYDSLVIGPVPASFVLMRSNDATVSPVDVFNNTFVNINGSGSDVISSLLSTATASIEIRNNIFHNCVDAIQGTTGVTKDYNVYSGTTPNESDTNGGTADPVFVDEAGGNYRLAPTSPYRSNGNGLRGAVDLAGRHRVNPPSRGAYQYRGGVRAASARRVAANR